MRKPLKLPDALPEHLVEELLRLALTEDVGAGDLTTQCLFGGNLVKARAHIIAKESMVLSGLAVAARVFHLVDHEVRLQVFAEDGEKVRKGAKVLEIRSPLQSILSAERVALNLLGRLCGIASYTRQCVDAVKATGVKILDTRKTTPLLRLFEKYAVTCGGGFNHRMGLYDAVLIKDTHLAALGDNITKALGLTQGISAPVEIEVKNLKELRDALAAGASWIMLDNFPENRLCKAVEINNGQADLEASGGITLDNIEQIAKTGVDFISLGALTHSVICKDLSLKIIP